MSLSALDYSIPIYYAVEVETFSPAGAGSFTAQVGYAATANMSFATATPALPTPGHLYASDTGYRTRSGDSTGMRIYKGRLDSAFAIDRRVELDPAKATGSVAWGTINLLNALSDYDGIANSSNSDARPVKVLAYNKIWDAKRQIYIDPPYANLVPVFTGIATPWFCDENALQIPIRDGTYFLQQPIQTSLYGGTGGLDGTADLTGKYIPMTRGGTAGAPVLNVSPIPVDPTHLVYQYTDGPGTVQALYEGQLAGGITFSADVADLYSGTTPAGQYRTCNAKGLFQLGSSPVYPITADVTGQFIASGAVTTIIEIAKQLLLEQSLLPTSMLNTAQFDAANALYPYVGGFFQGTDVMAGADAIDAVLSGIGAKLVPTRTGGLQCLVLRAPTGTPIASYDETQIVSLVANSVGAPLDPPPYRYRVGYQQNWTVQTSGFNPSASVTAARKSFVANQFRYAFAANAATLAAYQKPSDPDPLPGLMTSQSDAQSVANDLMALWGVRRRYYQIAFPIGLGIKHEIGDIITISYPTDDLQAGLPGVVIGEQFRGGDATTTLMVLI